MNAPEDATPGGTNGPSKATGGEPASGGRGRAGEHRGRTVENEIGIAADPARVWEAWADPARIADWFVERAVGRATDGGRVTWAWDRFGLEIEQEVLVADPPRRLLLRARDPDRGTSVLEVVLEGDGGQTVVRVVQSGFGGGPDADAAAEGVDSGWAIALGLLRLYMERWYGRVRSELMVLRPVPAACAAVAPYFRDPARLAEWLTAPPDVGDAAPPPRLELRDGRTITGEVLIDAGSEQLREWRQVGGALELKAFPTGDGGCTAGVRATSWQLSQTELQAWKPYFDAAVERLADRLA